LSSLRRLSVGSFTVVPVRVMMMLASYSIRKYGDLGVSDGARDDVAAME
jgi:hypothetical protein